MSDQPRPVPPPEPEPQEPSDAMDPAQEGDIAAPESNDADAGDEPSVQAQPPGREGSDVVPDAPVPNVRDTDSAL